MEENVKAKTEKLSETVESFFTNSYRLAVAKVTRKAANAASGFLNVWIILVFSFFLLMFLSLALGWWLGDLVNSRVGGFLMMAGVLLLLIIIVITAGKKIITPFIRNLIIRKVYD